MISVILITILLAGWVAAWCNWLFNGEIRQFVVSKFPRKWIGSRDRSDIAHMGQVEFMQFVCTVGGMPEFLRGVLTCPLCLSAHIAGVGTLLAARPIYVLSSGFWEIIPLAWAAAAVLGFLTIKKHL